MRRNAPAAALNAPFAKTARTNRARTTAGDPGAAGLCMAPGCHAPASHRAPISRDRLREYYWFCLEHARAYNARWDFFKGMNEREIERELRADDTWHRPTWRLGSGAPRFADPFGFFQESAESRAGRQKAVEQKTLGREAEALAVLNLQPPVAFAAVKARYKSLVKALHPDANGGDRSAEERLKIVNRAYSTLKTAYAQLAGQSTAVQPSERT